MQTTVCAARARRFKVGGKSQVPLDSHFRQLLELPSLISFPSMLSSTALVARLLVLQPPQQQWFVSMSVKASPLVLHEGDGWLVVNKPRGMIVHDGPESLIDALASAGYKGTSPVHRLDAETSGVMLFSQNPRGGKSDLKGQLTACLADPLTLKQYVGVVKGDLVGSGTWDQTISPKAEGRKNPRGVSAVRVPAETDYVALGLHSHLSVASFVLRSGRTHQIRKHAACNGFPIVGDARYGDPKHDEKVRGRCAFEGMAPLIASDCIGLHLIPSDCI